jgi:holliday junction DNA helicase RuvA
MIGLLRGVIIDKQPPLLCIDVNGLGYEVYVPMSTFYHLPDYSNPSLYLLI